MNTKCYINFSRETDLVSICVKLRLDFFFPINSSCTCKLVNKFQLNEIYHPPIQREAQMNAWAEVRIHAARFSNHSSNQSKLYQPSLAE